MQTTQALFKTGAKPATKVGTKKVGTVKKAAPLRKAGTRTSKSSGERPHAAGHGAPRARRRDARRADAQPADAPGLARCARHAPGARAHRAPPYPGGGRSQLPARSWRAPPSASSPLAPSLLSPTITPPDLARAPAPLPIARAGDSLWLPNTTRPSWLDGSLPGDRGFDPLGLAKPVEYLQADIDQLDQNKAVNKPGSILGSFKPAVDQVSTDRLQPYSEVFGLQRFRETELIHGRWAMLAALGVIVAEASTGVAWQDAGKVELDGTSYLGLPLPFSVSQLSYIEAILVRGVGG
jgi:hypothetical protein